jgi:hypothetical protein
MQVCESLPYSISIKLLEVFMAYMEKSIYCSVQPRIYYRSIRLKSQIILVNVVSQNRISAILICNKPW